MDKKVKYYKAINDRYDLLKMLIDSTHIEQYVGEFIDEVEGIITVAIYEQGFDSVDFVRLRKYATRMQKKARALPRQPVASSGANPEGGNRYNCTNCPINRTPAHCTIEYNKPCAFCIL